MTHKAGMTALAAAALAALVALGLALGGKGAGNKENDPRLPPLPAVTFYDSAGKAVALEDFRGQVVLVNLWATWCPPCVAEMPSLDMLQARVKGMGVHVAAVSQDRGGMDEVLAFFRDQKIDHLQPYWDKDRETVRKWSYAGLPVTFLIDREGRVAGRYEGPYEWHEGKMFDLIASLAQERPASPTAAP